MSRPTRRTRLAVLGTALRPSAGATGSAAASGGGSGASERREAAAPSRSA
ncbi:hypothetical protein [Streptomyces sp. NPDC058371]